MEYGQNSKRFLRKKYCHPISALNHRGCLIIKYSKTKSYSILFFMVRKRTQLFHNLYNYKAFVH